MPENVQPPEWAGQSYGVTTITHGGLKFKEKTNVSPPMRTMV